jgi:23S rRNA (guanosine2251-2'-O)-methyltransferase
MAQIIYGIHPVEEALKSPNVEVEKILLGQRRSVSTLQPLLDLARKRGVPVLTVSNEALNEMAGGGLHQSVVAFLKEIPYADLHEILQRWREKKEKALFVVLDGIQDPHNLGALIRTALGCGAHGLIIPKDRAVGMTPTVVKASAGATAHLPVARVTNLATTIEALKHEGLWVFGAAAEAKERIYEVDFTVDLAVVIGAEGKGMRPLVKKKCDRLFFVPMKGPMTSFNASVCGGMILYEVMRQRHLSMKG